MPPHLIPQQSGIHRAACFALYRALLRQTPTLASGSQIDHAHQRRVQERLGNTFRHNAKIQSPRAIVTALRQGYHALDLSPAALNGDKEASQQLSQYVDALRSTAPIKPQPDQQRRRGRAEVHGDAKKQEVETKSTTTPTSIFDRPFPNLSGRRTVPHLISANGFPFLRYQRQQSPALSRTINGRIKAYCNRWDRTYEYQDQVQMGKLEDAWERDISRYCGFGRGSDPGPSWSEEPLRALDILQAISRRQSTRTRTMAKEMYQVMEKERELAKKERLARRDEKHRRYKARRLARREPPDSEEELKAAPASMAGL